MGDLWIMAVSSAVVCILAAVLRVTTSPVFHRTVRTIASLGSAADEESSRDAVHPYAIALVRYSSFFVSASVHLYLLELAGAACVSPGARLADPWLVAVLSVTGALVLTTVGAFLDWLAYRDAIKPDADRSVHAEETVLLERYASSERIRVQPAQRLRDNSDARIGTGLWPFLLVIQFTYLTVTLGVFGDTQTNSQVHVNGTILGLLLTYALLLYVALHALYFVARRLDAPAEASLDKPLPWIRRYDHCELVYWIRWVDAVSDAAGLWALASSVLLSLYLVVSVSETSLAFPSAWSALVPPVYISVGTTSSAAVIVQFANARVERLRDPSAGNVYYH